MKINKLARKVLGEKAYPEVKWFQKTCEIEGFPVVEITASLTINMTNGEGREEIKFIFKCKSSTSPDEGSIRTCIEAINEQFSQKVDDVITSITK